MNDFFKVLGFFLKTYRKETLFAIVFIIISGLFEAIGLMAFLPFFQLVLEGEATINHIPDGSFKNFLIEHEIPLNILNVGVFIAGAMCLKALILWIAMRKVSVTVAKIAADLRKRLLSSLLNARWSFFVHQQLGVSLNAIINETFTSSMAFTSSARLISGLVQFSVYAAGAMIISWQLFAGAALTGALLAGALWSLVRIARSASTKQVDLSKKMLSHMADMLQGIKALRAMALENKFMNLLFGHSKGLEGAQTKQLISSQSMRIFHEPLLVITAIFGLYGAVTYGNLNPSELAVMSVIFIRLLSSMNAIQNEYQRMVMQQAALWSLIDTIEKAEGESEEWLGNKAPPKDIENIELKNVEFSHDETRILNGINLKISSQSLTALIGPSGSGKTTILDLLSGFHTADKGKVLINSKDIQDLDLKSWRETLGFVPQEVFLFNDSIRENILIGRNEYEEEDIWNALKAADAESFVKNLDNQLDESVGEGGRRLSGGQRQRIAIARALLHKPQILLLDEATSALDPETEKNLLNTLKHLAEKMTVILISHNTSVQSFADTVYELENGAIIKANKK